MFLVSIFPTSTRSLLLACVDRGRALEPHHPELLLRSIQLYHLAQTTPSVVTGSTVAASATQGNSKSSSANIGLLEPPSPLVARVLAEEAEGLLGEGGLKGAVASLVALAEDADRGSLKARVCAAKALVLIGEGRDQALELIRGGLRGRGVTVAACVGAVKAVEEIERGEGQGQAAQELREACREVFSMAEAFGAGGEGGSRG